MSEKRLQRFVYEFVARHNLRELDTIDQMEELARGMIGKRVKHSDLIS